MHTITLKTDDNFFEMLSEMVSRLGTTKSELIRNAVLNYKETLEQEALKSQLQKASQKVREHSSQMVKEWDETLVDGLENV